MAPALLRVNLPFITNLPRDVAVNTFAMDVAGDPGLGLATALVDFYNADTGGRSASIASWLSPVIDRSSDACSIEFYALNLASGETGPPTGIQQFTLGPTTADAGLPQECAVCLSYFNNETPAVPLKRRRGRIWMGPLVGAVLSNLDGGLPSVANQFAEDLAIAARELKSDLNDIGATWSVWSRSDAALYEITDGWVDNEFDTMRSRQVDATFRTTFT